MSPSPVPAPTPAPPAEPARDAAAADRRAAVIAWCRNVETLLDLPLPAVRRR